MPTIAVRDRPRALWLLVALLAQLSVRATLGGLALVADPSGGPVGLEPGALGNTPFADFLVPGLVLALALGVAPATAVYGLLVRRGWALTAALGVGLALLAWLAVEVAVGFTRPTLALNLATAVGVLALARHPSVRRDLGRRAG